MSSSDRFSRSEILHFRFRAQQLDRTQKPRRKVTDAAVFDLGVQTSGAISASWSLVCRGVPFINAEALDTSPDVALAWTIRGAPHFYRRVDLPGVQVATSPFSDADAGKRIFDANRPLKAAGVPALEALAEVATEMRRLVQQPMVKGDMSEQLAQALPAHYLRFCRVCDATHLYEQPFRLAALQAGLELEPGTSPPVLRRIPGWPRRAPGPAPDPLAAPEHLQPIRAYLRLYGPSTPKDVAAYLDAPVAEVKKHWPDEAVDVQVDGAPRSGLPTALPGADDAATDETATAQTATAQTVRLIGGYDLYLQARDRDLVLPDKAQHKLLWPSIGRPGAILQGPMIAGVWRPQSSGQKLSVRITLWDKPRKAITELITEQAERLAAHRGQTFTGLIDD